MNIIINHLDLPCDIKYVITTFCYNHDGYTYCEKNAIQKCRKQKEAIVLRFLAEFKYWKSTETSIQWLKPGPRILGSGAYTSDQFELNRLKEMKENNVISSESYAKIMNVIENEKQTTTYKKN